MNAGKQELAYRIMVWKPLEVNLVLRIRLNIIFFNIITITIITITTTLLL